MNTIDDIIAVTTAYKEGKLIESKPRLGDEKSWLVDTTPSWDFSFVCYRIKPLSDRILIPEIGNCARCGFTHLNLMFEEFERPSSDMTHWAECPRTLQPILMKVVNEGTSNERIQNVL